MTGTPEYADVEIRILPRQEGGYPVELTLDRQQEYGPGTLGDDLLPWVPTGSAEADGERLFRALFADPALRACWGEIRGQHPQRRLRLRIDRDAPEAHAIPWELLREPGEVQAARDLCATEATPFSRYLAGSSRPGGPVLQRPLRILVAVSAPDDLAEFGLEPLDPDAEVAELRTATDGLDAELTVLPAPCSLAALEQALQDGHHVLHLVSHGHFDREANDAALFLADAENRTRPTPATELAAAFGRQLADTEPAREDTLRLVFLASCQTATRSSADAFRGCAPQLVHQGVPAVVAMQDLVPIDTAREFARTFYGRLLEHGLVDLAGNQARAYLMTTQPEDAAIPVLFMRLRDGRLLGTRGRLSTTSGGFWKLLVEQVHEQRCVPFLGAGVNTGLLPSPSALAQRLAEDFDYPLDDPTNLAHVTQFMALLDRESPRRNVLQVLARSLFRELDVEPTSEQKRLFGRAGEASLAEAVGELDWAERVLALNERPIHHLLAELRLPLYVTTNIDGFLHAALARSDAAITPRQVAPRWDLGDGEPYSLQPPPSDESPVVLHLNGFAAPNATEPELVLTEDEILAHLVHLARDQNTYLPMNVIERLSTSSFLFLGYSLDDWDLRLLLHGLLRRGAGSGRRRAHVGVQLRPNEPANSEAAVDYLQRYFLESFQIHVYWGDSQTFVSELHEHLREGDEW